MKIRTLILVMMIVAVVISTASLATFASRGMNEIKGVTSDASSGEMLSSASNNLKNIATGIRDSLDDQMQNQYEMVNTWAQAPSTQEVARLAQGRSLEELYEMWSEEGTREYDDGEAVGDGNSDNDLSPAASQYLEDLVASTAFSEIFITDSRGYAIASNGVTGDFDQGPDDWRVFLEDGSPVFKKHKPAEGGEGWYRDTNLESDGLYVGDVVWDDSVEAWGVEVVSQIRDSETNAYLGQLKAVFNYGAFIGNFATTSDQEIYEIKVIDQDGIVVATSLADKSKVNNEEINLSQNAYFTQIISGEKVGFTSEAEQDENGSSVFSGYAVSDDVNGHIVVVSKQAEVISAPINAFIGGLQSQIGDKSAALQRTMWLVGVGVAILIMLVAFFVIRAKISRPIKQMVETADEIAQTDLSALVTTSIAIANGDLNQSLEINTKEIPVKSNDEMGQLAQSFNQMIRGLGEVGGAFSQMTTNLRDVIGQVGDIAGNLSGASDQLSRASEQAGQATNQIAATSQQVARGAGEQSTALQETTQGVIQLSQAIEKISKGTREQSQSVEKNTEIVTQVSAAVEQISKNAQEAAEGSKQAAENAGKGAQMARNTVEGMEKVKVSNANVSARVTELGDRSNEIGKIVATIDDIAAQTNLLALNAAIEAARAGEQGRGFAVVADEVRQLAERSSQATKEIADLIKGIQQSVSEAVSAMETGTVEVESGYQLATDAGNSLEEILGSSKAVGSQVEQISAAVQELTALSENMVQVSDKITKVVEENTAATEQMSASSDQVSRSVESVAGVAEENSAATEQVSASAQQMSAQVEEVVASSQSLAAMSEELQQAISQFSIHDDGNGSVQQVAAVSRN